MIKILSKKKVQYATVSTVNLEKGRDERPNIPDGMWVKCPKCGQILYSELLCENLKVCTNCSHHFRLTAKERINYTLDKDSFEKIDCDIEERNPLDFPGYNEKIKRIKYKTNIEEAVTIGTGTITGKKVVVAIMDSHFMMGSMGIVVGERITTAVEYATENKLPIIIFTTSGGARMQEGMFSLMQMAKTSAALSKHSQAGLLYITVLTDPTTGGVTASFAMLGDIILSEPDALIGFAGRRVIENTINEKLPDNFQKAEFLLEKGFVDKIVKRRDMRDVLSKLLLLHEVKI
ncbi:MAG: acetyl-CoA carboxylase, carboxyltransferase subunit beta [Clostridiaceae bacterium]|nr:acetyl-CoA carboxylase, carboxyltransferase subunit beta [Clostridiaceae bacterium]